MIQTYKNFTLDDFQIDAIAAIERNNSVVVSAATGTGKTLIADYVINKAIKEDKRVVYTAPIKALSNQKFREFKKEYGDKIGLLTGDAVINPGAQIQIMTTEIYRNMLLEKSPDIATISYVVFDEIHYINDLERGTVWEESIIFSPDTVRFLCLSATIPNFKQFADWISTIKHHVVETVHYMKRAVPLQHFAYDIKLGITTLGKIKKDMNDNSFPVMHNKYGHGRGQHGQQGGRSQRPNRQPMPHHTDLIKELEQHAWLPCIFFSFSRALCEQRALELSRKRTFTNAEQRKQIIEYVDSMITDTIKDMESTHFIREMVIKGIGVHHAGLLPRLKEIVENLFDKCLLRVLYATETFAVGINMPAKTVCFGSLEKYDGVSFRVLNSKEYFQLAGRAGRRGIDTAGYSIAIIDRNNTDVFPVIERITEADIEPIQSRYDLSYNTVLNLVKSHNKEQIDVILTSNFGAFVRKQSKQSNRTVSNFHNYVKTLESLGFLENGKVTWKGDFASRIYTMELEVAELLFSGILEKLTIQEMNVLLAALIYEPRRADEFDIEHVDPTPLLKHIISNDMLAKKIKKITVQRMQKVVTQWTDGADFLTIMTLCNLAEGDIIRLFRQLIDILRQIKGSLITSDPRHTLIGKIQESLARLDRDIIKIEL